MYCYFNNSHLLQYIALILNMLIKQFYNRVIDEQSCLVHLQKYACVVLLILDTNVLIMCNSVNFFNDLNESWNFVRMHADLASALFDLRVSVCIQMHLHAHVEMFTRCQMSQLLQVVFFFFFKDKHDRIWVHFVFSFYWIDSTVDNSWSHWNLRLFLNTREYNHFLKAIIIW